LPVGAWAIGHDKVIVLRVYALGQFLGIQGDVWLDDEFHAIQLMQATLYGCDIMMNK
jgi:hypothetical protein